MPVSDTNVKQESCGQAGANCDARVGMAVVSQLLEVRSMSTTRESHVGPIAG
jgi:hypothetical protein